MTITGGFGVTVALEFTRMRDRIEELRGALKSASGWLADLGDMEHAIECIEMAGDMEPPTIPITQIDRVIGGDD